MRHSTGASLAIIALILLTQACQPTSNTKETSSLGKIDFKVTSSPEAVDSFEKGVLLLHSFMYADAALEFKKAQEIDPEFAMAYWGEAMTYNHPLWFEQDYEKATDALSRLGASTTERIAKAPSDFEKDIFQGAEILYGEGTKIERDDAYAAYLGTLSEKYPTNHEISAFYALSLLGSIEEGRDYDVYEKGAKIAQGILNENPRHPGALHYLIHSYDDPDHASLALEAANKYSEVAPDAGHALHMPSHIYISMGMWDRVISSNIRSYDARLKRIESNTATSWNLHAYHWLLYGYLQKNDLENVQKIMNRMSDYAEENGGNLSTKSYLIDMVGNYLAETNNWKAEIPSLDFDTEGLNVRFEVSKDFIAGYTAFMNEDNEQVAKFLSDIEVKIQSAEDKLITRGVSVCSGGGFASRPPSQDDIDLANVLALQLKIAQSQLEGKNDEYVEELMLAATAMEADISFVFGPPAIIFPTNEMYGNWLLEKGRYDEAINQFDKSLEKGPGRRNALLGKLQAANGAGNLEVVKEIETIIAKNNS